MRRWCALASVLFVPVFLAAGPLSGQEPENRQFSFHYALHAEPSDPESPVLFTVSYFLTLAEQGEGSAGWRVDKVRFKQYDAEGELIGVWKIENPILNTPDGLWWTQHARAVAPELAEFTLPPRISGTALSEFGSPHDLDFEFEGLDRDPSAQSETPPDSGTLSWYLAYSGASSPESEGDDEPVDIEGPHDSNGDTCVDPTAINGGSN